MGYCYQGSALVCDGCGTASGVRKRPCPHRWCQAPALCESCNEHKAPTHAGCAQRAADYARRNEVEAELLAAGEFVRKSALGDHRGEVYRVHVVFKNAAGEYKGYYMSQETYGAFSLLKPATPAMFEQHGTLTEAPPNFY